MNTMPIRNGIAAEFIKKLNTSKTFTDQATVLVTLQPYTQQHSGFCMSLLCKTDNFNSFLSQTWGPPPTPTPNFNGFTVLSNNIVGNPLCHYPSKQMGAIATGAILSPSPHKGFLRQMIPFQVDNRPTSQFSFSPLTVSVRCHLQRDETWQTWPRDNILQPKGGRLLGSVPHINDSFVSWSCRKMSDYNSRSSDKLFLDYYSLF